MKPSKLCNLSAIAGLTATSMFFSLSANAQPTQQQQMTHIKIRMLEPAPAAGTFAAEPKEYWRSRKVFARVAEGPDHQMKIQQLMIVNEPDVWLLELMSKRGKHIVDPGPKYEIHVRMFDPGLKELGSLEYGNEVEFFKAHKAKESEGPAINGKPTTRLDLALEGYQLGLFVDKARNVPLRIAVTLPNKKSYSLEYMVYETLKFDPELFKLPSGFQLEEQKIERPKVQHPVILPMPPPPRGTGSALPSKSTGATPTKSK